MYSRFFLSIAILVCIHPGVFSQSLIDSRTDSLIKQGIRFSITEAYEKALDVFVTMEQSMPQNPVGYFFHAAVLHTQMMDYERYDAVDDFERLLHKTLKLSRARRSADPWGDFLIGGAYGYLAFHQGKQKKLIEAFKSGKHSIRALESAMARDSTIADALVGLGTYNYYRSKFSRHLSWIPFVDDDRGEAISMIEKALTRSYYSKYSALNALTWIYLDEGRFDKAGELLATAMTEFPDARLFLWAAAKHAKQTERWHLARDYYRRILVSFQKQGVSSPYNEMSCYKNLIEASGRLGEEHDLIRLCESLRKVGRQDLSKRDKEKFNEVIKLCVECCEVSRFVEAE